ncbi:MAG: serine/threonine protein kinase [Myxococcales bacterium]|nr:serine/threonine protein kinase [Myxococcales bacterium]
MGTAPKPPKAPDPPPPAIKVGDMVLDRYRVVEQIASGGHSVVYRGQDERLNRPVCIKVFSGLGGKSGLGRTSYEHFVQEAFALSRLTHPNTLRIYDFGHLGQKDAEGMPLQVCEFMNGGTLSNVVREQGKQSLAEMVRVTSAMCAALGEAHALGIVHRDIKPQNILFGSVGGSKLPKLADFGIAKWSVDAENEDSGQRAEDTAIVAGQKLAMYSPSWAAPEQLAGQPVSPATDIYSLAVVAIYMLSGKAIFADEDVYAGYKKRRHADDHIKEALKPLGLGKPVIELFVRALAFDPKKRLSKVDDFATALGELLEGDEASKLPPPPLDPTQPLTPTVPTQAITPPAGSAVVSRSGTNSEITDPVAQQPAPPPKPRATSAGLGIAGSAPPEQYPAAAPAPVQAPARPSAPVIYHPPPALRAPWMANAPIATGPARVLALTDVAQTAGDRAVHFVHSALNASADLMGPDHMRVRITMIHAPAGLVIHLKGMTCFVAHLGGRPSPAVQIDHPGDIALVTPRAQEVGHIRVAIGVAEAPSQLVFSLGTERVAVRSDDCSDPILFDFGPGSDAYFVYTRGRPIPKSVHRR